MRGWLLGLSLPLVLALACSGRSVGSGGHETSQQVESSLPSWCQSTCQKLVSCNVDQDCACNGDVCECAGGVGTLSQCTGNCQESLGERARLSDACAQEVARFKRCVDAQGCRAIENNDVCPVDNRACDDEGGDVANPPPVGGDTAPGAGGTTSNPGSPPPPPMTGAAGSTSTPAGPGLPATGGGPSGPPSMVGPAVHCNSGFGSAGAGPLPPGAQVICEEGRDSCSDGSSYYTICVTTSGGQSSCSCFRDSQLVTAFDPGGRCPTLPQVNAGCGWNLQ